MKRIKIVVHNTHFSVEVLDKTLNHFIDSIKGFLITYKFVYNRQKRKNIMVKDKGYYVEVKGKRFYRFTINIVKDFIIYLGKYLKSKDEIEIVYDKEVNYKRLKLKFNPKIVLRDYQNQYVDILTDDESSSMLLVDLATGMGKTALSMYAVVKLDMVTAIIILPKYIEKWIDDVKKYTNVKDDEIYVVQGGDSLNKLLDMDNHDYKFIIFSMRTLYNYYRDYEENKPVILPPYEIAEKLNVGLVLNDEAHQEFYTVFRSTLFWNVKKFISLSATLDSNQKSVKAIYNILYPKENRISNIIKYEPYIDVTAVEYLLNSTAGIQYKRAQGYSHILYEQSLLLNYRLLKEYMDMINYYVKEGYIKRRKKGQKLLIFVASIKLATILTNYITELYPDLDVRRYVEDDPYENVINADITISTVLSSGTAIDIPGLITVINTISISSLQANVQAVGRLRKIKGVETRYYYLYSGSIKNQVKMHHDRHKAIKHMANRYNRDRYDKILSVR